jgi:hypothetical protein
VLGEKIDCTKIQAAVGNGLDMKQFANIGDDSAKDKPAAVETK